MITTKMIGSKIGEARKKKNISQAELAQRLFISAQAVGKWERGESMPDITTFNRIAEILETDLNYFSESYQTTTGEMTPAEPLEQAAGSPGGKDESSGRAGKKLNWDMSRGNWVDADFSGLKDLHEKFSEANMQRCKFINSELAGLLLKSNHVDGCDFSSADMSSSHIRNSYLVNNQFRDCSLKEAEFLKSHVNGCDFSEANFSGVKFKSTSFSKNSLAQAMWLHTAFIDSSLEDIVFEGSIEDCYFEHCGFKKVTFRNAILTNTFFKNKNLKGVRFVDSQADRMTYEFLKNGKADLSGITLLTD